MRTGDGHAARPPRHRQQQCTIGEPLTPTPLLLTPLNILQRQERRAREGRRHGQDAGSYSVDSRTAEEADRMCGVSFVHLQGYLRGKKGNTWTRVNVKWNSYKRLWGSAVRRQSLKIRPASRLLIIVQTLSLSILMKKTQQHGYSVHTRP